MLNSKITQMTFRAVGTSVRRLDCAERARTVEDSCKGPDPTVDIELSDGIAVLSGIDVARLKIDAIR